MAGPIFGLVKDTKNPHECKKIDAMRVKKYIGCYIYKNRTLPFDEFVLRARAPIEHLFDCHEWCDKEWCWAKELDANAHKVVLANMRQCQECDLPAFSFESSNENGLLLSNPSSPADADPNLELFNSDQEKYSDSDISTDSDTISSLEEVDSDEMNIRGELTQFF